LQVLHRLTEGFTNQKIADVLNISKDTVKDDLKSIFRKLQVANRTEAVTTAIQSGIIQLPNLNQRTCEVGIRCEQLREPG
jgi:DNA-binding NarL/FixJ family response regulator